MALLKPVALGTAQTLHPEPEARSPEGNPEYPWLWELVAWPKEGEEEAKEDGWGGAEACAS